jgi:DNA-directed RNA polymerase specialized sigma24 family protein
MNKQEAVSAAWYCELFRRAMLRAEDMGEAMLSAQLALSIQPEPDEEFHLDVMLATEGAGRQVGEKWESQTAKGRWYTKRPDGRVVPTKAPGQEQPAPRQPGQQETVTPPTPPSAPPEAPAAPQKPPQPVRRPRLPKELRTATGEPLATLPPVSEMEVHKGERMARDPKTQKVAPATGESRDSAGRRICYSQGKRVACQLLASGQVPERVHPARMLEDIKKAREEGGGTLSPEALNLVAGRMASMTVRELQVVRRGLTKQSATRRPEVENAIRQAIGLPLTGEAPFTGEPFQPKEQPPAVPEAKPAEQVRPPEQAPAPKEPAEIKHAIDRLSPQAKRAFDQFENTGLMLADRLKALAGADVWIIDPVQNAGLYERAGITNPNNELLRHLYLAHDRWERSIKRQGDRDRLDKDTATVKANLDNMVAGLQKLHGEGVEVKDNGGRSLDLGAAAEVYRQSGNLALTEVREDAGLPAETATPSPEAPKPTPDLASVVDRLAPAANGLVSLADLSRETGLKGSELHQAALDLIESGKYSGSAAEGRQGISKEEQEAMIPEGTRSRSGKVSNEVLYISPKGPAPARDGSTPSPAAAPQEKKQEKRPSPADLQRVADETRTGAFGKNKVMVSHAWEQAKKEYPSLTLDEFKQALLEAHRAGHLQLSRADLVGAMNLEDVAKSEIPYLNATWHLINVKPDETRERTKGEEHRELPESPDAYKTTHQMTLARFRQKSDYDRSSRQGKADIDREWRKKVGEAIAGEVEIPPEVREEYDRASPEKPAAAPEAKPAEQKGAEEGKEAKAGPADFQQASAAAGKPTAPEKPGEMTPQKRNEMLDPLIKKEKGGRSKIDSIVRAVAPGATAHQREDFAQTVALRLADILDGRTDAKFDPERGSLETLARSVAKTTADSYFKKKGNKGHPGVGEGEGEYQAAAKTAGPAEEAEGRDELEQQRKTFQASLKNVKSEKHRKILTGISEGKSEEELAREVRLSVPAFRTARLRAIEAMKKAVEQPASLSEKRPPAPRKETAAPKPKVERQSIVEKMAEIEPQLDTGATVLIRDLRKATSGQFKSKKEFDRAIFELAEADEIALHRHDQPSFLTDKEREELVRDEQGTYYTAAAKRI